MPPQLSKVLGKNGDASQRGIKKLLELMDIFTIWLQWWGWGEEGGSRGKALKRMKTQESQVLLLRNYVTSLGKSTFLSPNVLTCRGGLNHVAPEWAVRIKRSTLCTADTASTAPACRKSMVGANLIQSSPFSCVHKHRYQKASSCRTTNTRGNWS